MANELIALLAEGAAEQAILDVLLDNDKLIYRREELLNEEILRERSATRFQRRYLGLGFSKKIKIYRILDSKGEQFKLGKAYQQKISDVTNLYTTPEIEILFVILHHDYDNYTNKQKSKLKPSVYVKQKYGVSLKTWTRFLLRYNRRRRITHDAKIYPRIPTINH
ncbi:N-6 DNA methylase [Leuconostoc sp. MS02]|uniref:N-6 DNA methylase n=1 Tax=Leuconostoc aquikimchii TaxID=3236804 RepID=A0ABV3S3U0_9LACO